MRLTLNCWPRYQHQRKQHHFSEVLKRFGELPSLTLKSASVSSSNAELPQGTRAGLSMVVMVWMPAFLGVRVPTSSAGVLLRIIFSQDPA